MRKLRSTLPYIQKRQRVSLFSARLWLRHLLFKNLLAISPWMPSWRVSSGRHPVQDSWHGDRPWGNVRTAFDGKFSINRSDFGIMKYLDRGKGIVGNEIEITLLVEALKIGQDGQSVNMKAPPAQPPVA